MAERRTSFDPISILKVLDRHRVSYIVIGGFARVIHGADEITDGIDLVPSIRPENTQRLQAALDELGAQPDEARRSLAENPVDVHRFQSPSGDITVVPQPAGTQGYDDLRRAATREPLGAGVRPSVASVGDLSRMLATVAREQDIPHLQGLRRLAELELGRGLER